LLQLSLIVPDFLLSVFIYLLIVNKAVSASVHEVLMPILVLVPQFATAALKRIWNRFNGYISQYHGAPRFSPPNLDSQGLDKVSCRYAVNDAIIAEFVWLGQLAVNHSDVGHSLVAISKGCVYAPSFVTSFAKASWSQSGFHNAVMVRWI
jgi:hypothetical protein